MEPELIPIMAQQNSTKPPKQERKTVTLTTVKTRTAFGVKPQQFKKQSYFQAGLVYIEYFFKRHPETVSVTFPMAVLWHFCFFRSDLILQNHKTIQNPVWLGGLRSPASLRSPSDRSGSLREASEPTCQTGQTNLAPRGGTKPVGSIESFGAPP